MLPGSTHIPQALGRSHLLLDINSLFVAASLREELWLFSGQEHAPLLARICREAAEFGIRGVNPGRELATFSGGEQAILACLLVLALIQAHGLESLKLLLSGVLESLSEENLKRLKLRFEAAARTHGIEVHCLRDNQIQAVTLASCNC